MTKLEKKIRKTEFKLNSGMDITKDLADVMCDTLDKLSESPDFDDLMDYCERNIQTARSHYYPGDLKDKIDKANVDEISSIIIKACDYLLHEKDVNSGPASAAMLDIDMCLSKIFKLKHLTDDFDDTKYYNYVDKVKNNEKIWHKEVMRVLKTVKKSILQKKYQSAYNEGSWLSTLSLYTPANGNPV